jgi:Domain of unknown function (DUF4388)
MTLAGYLSEYSLAEIFNFVHEGNRTGLLEISPDPNAVTAPHESRFVWFEAGRTIAATSGLDGKGLLQTIGQRKFVPPDQIDLMATQLHQLPQPLGIYLKSRGLLDAEQLKLLFNSQTIAAVCKLFELKNRQFRFDPAGSPSNSELTGIGLPAQEVGILGLRVLKDWSGLSAKLPDPDYAVQRWSAQQPSFRLDRHELQLWKLADGETTLAKIAEKMDLSIDVIRQISFRLSSFRLIQEIPNDPIAPISEELSGVVSPPVLEIGTKNPSLSSSFLGNLKNFLKKGSTKSAKSLTK